MKVGYERDFLRYLQSLLAEVERRIRRGHARLALSQNQQSSGVRMKLIYNLCKVSLFSGELSSIETCVQVHSLLCVLLK